ncbi:MAG: hypothetical protein RI894_72 [Bacteroidota bacterium]|jgi:transposase-like protein
MKSQNGANAQKQNGGVTGAKGAAKILNRYSTEYKKEIVRRLDAKETTIAALLRDETGLSSASVYRWLELYSPKYQKAVIQVTELASESERSKRFEAENKKLLGIIGAQQVEVMYWKTLVDVAEAYYNIDIKKNCLTVV